jgi:hypothetical protein
MQWRLLACECEYERCRYRWQAGQSAAIKPAVEQLAAAGYQVAFLNGVVNGSPSGCGGHPGPTVHRAAFEALQPQVPGTYLHAQTPHTHTHADAHTSSSIPVSVLAPPSILSSCEGTQ